MTRSRIALLLLLAGLLAAWFVFDLGRYFSFEYLKAQQAQLQQLYQAQPAEVIAIYFVVYVVAIALSVPGATILTLAGGAVFGLFWGTLIVSFASSIGATLAFVVSRYLLRSWVEQRYSQRLRAINRGVETQGAFYLFAMRLVPVVPFFFINLALGVTRMRLVTFYWVSQLGMLLGTLVYVNAGTQLAQIDSIRGLLSPELIAAFALLAILPLLARRLLDWLKARRVYRGHQKPRRFDRNLIVIGAGSAGLVTAYIAAAVKARVTLIEKHQMGGDCLNTGCVPSKALIRSAKFFDHVRRGREFGASHAEASVDFPAVMARVQRIIKAIEPHDSVARYTELGVDCIAGEAQLIDPWTVVVNGRKLTARNIVIATGARPLVPPIEGIEQVHVWTSDNLWSMRELPRRLCVLGGGPIGSELSQAFARLGSEVTQVEMLERVLIREDQEVSAMVQARFEQEGIRVCTGHKALAVKVEGGRKWLLCEHDGRPVDIEFDALLCAVGRVAHLDGYGLKELGVSADKTVTVDEFMRTNFPNILACGDVAGPYQFTHTAAHQAWYAAVNALFGQFRKFKADYSVIPWATFTEPEVARVGLNEQDAQAQGVAYEVTTFGIDDLDRAIADGEAHGMVKVLSVPGKDRILGVTIVGEHAGDLIAEYILAMRHGIGLNKLLGTIHIYPTLAEANKYAAGAWKRAHAPQQVLNWLARYHRWRRR